MLLPLLLLLVSEFFSVCLAGWFVSLARLFCFPSPPPLATSITITIHGWQGLYYRASA